MGGKVCSWAVLLQGVDVSVFGTGHRSLTRMIETRFQHWMKRGLGPLLAAFMLLGICASSSRAGGCDHRSHAVPASVSTSFAFLAETGALPASVAGTAPLRQDPGMPRPCSGPSCSGGSNSSLPPAPTAILVVIAEQWAVLEPALPMPQPGSQSLLVTDSPEHPSYAVNVLLKPPRRPFA